MSRQKADGKLLDCFFCVVAALPLLGTATGVRHMRSRGRRVDVLVAARARADALVAHGATCSACRSFVLASCSACMCSCCTIAMCVEALDVCILAAGGANVPRWLGRQLFASDDFLLEQRCGVWDKSNSRRSQHTHALTALCVQTQISMASTHNAP